MELRSFKIKLYQAIDSPKQSEVFFNKHVEVLKSFGVGDITSISNRWQFKPTVWLFVLENEDGEMIGGVRLDVKSGFNMPLEYALKAYPSVTNLARKYEIESGVAELCGLWIDKAYRKANLALALMKAAIATAPNINVNRILGFANEYSLKSTLLLGFNMINTVENEGTFYYPDERYKSYLIELDALNFKTSDTSQEELIYTLRQNLNHMDLENTKEGVNMIQYELETENIRIQKMAEELKAELVRVA